MLNARLRSPTVGFYFVLQISQFIVEATRTVEIRVDKLSALRYQPQEFTCCFTFQCACSTKIHACVFDLKFKTCLNDEPHVMLEIGGLAVERTQSLLLEDAQYGVNRQSLGLQMEFIYGPGTGHNDTLLGQYWLDISGLPSGPNRDEVGWASFDLDTVRGVLATVQVKVYCTPGHFGNDCSQRCIPVKNEYYCNDHGVKQCLGLWSGPDCDRVDPCLSFPCLNAGTCISEGTSFRCVCDPLYTGKDCSMGINSCASVPCHQTATCVDLLNGYQCLCPLDRTGRFCETEFNDCRKHGCQNSGNCVQDQTSQNFVCDCTDGYLGDRCQNSICQPGICQNGGTCSITGRNSYNCECTSGFKGRHCDIIMTCASRPCQNGGRCFQDFQGNRVCQCTVGYKGDECELRDPCASSPCGNKGICLSDPNSQAFRCECNWPYSGQLCNQKYPCLPNPCQNLGVCSVDLKNQTNVRNFSCECQVGYSGSICETRDPCLSRPCKNGGSCISSVINGYSSFTCSCRNGYEGKACETHSACASNPCKNGGQCVANGVGYFCQCLSGYSGKDCDRVSLCLSNPCLNNASCFESSNSFVCTCQTGFTGRRCESPITLRSNRCLVNPCVFGTCTSSGSSSYHCACSPGFTGTNCTVSRSDLCSKITCQNNGVCVVANSSAICVCPSGFIGKFCQTPDPCNPGCPQGQICLSHKPPSPCGQNGQCQTCNDGQTCSSGGRNYICSCSQGYIGTHCDVRDPCVDNQQACRNGGICIPVAALRTYTCLCPSGRRSRDCGLLTPCSSNPCLNNGICQTVSSTQNIREDYTCRCPPGFTGKNCDLLSNCFLVPCLNGGTCLSKVQGREIDVGCECTSGYTGTRCEKRMTCPQHPCQNNGRCVAKAQFSGVDSSKQSMVCSCTSGFQGDFCEIPSDCRNRPCLNFGICTANTRGEMYCKCAAGFVGQRCENRLTCTDGSCLNGGFCQRGFYGLVYNSQVQSHCICRPGFTGLKCEKVVTSFECGNRICQNNGSCVQFYNGTFMCRCLPGWAGPGCDLRTNLDTRACTLNLCRNGGQCSVDRVTQQAKCACPQYFRGTSCQIPINPCANQNLCLFGGTCVSSPSTTLRYTCICPIGFSGNRCQTTPSDPCRLNPCRNNGKCSLDPSRIRGFHCRCPSPFTGEICDVRSRGACISFPCKNMGTCREAQSGTYYCQCLGGWTGRHCHIWGGGRGLCQVNYCSGRGVCYQDRNDQSACQCDRGFGLRCENTCGSQPMGLFPHPAECSKYIMCVWGIPHVMNCPRQGLHFNARLGLCDWSGRAGCGTNSAAGNGFDYNGFDDMRCPSPFTGEICDVRSRGACISFPCKNMGTCRVDTKTQSEEGSYQSGYHYATYDGYQTGYDSFGIPTRENIGRLKGNEKDYCVLQRVDGDDVKSKDVYGCDRNPAVYPDIAKSTSSRFVILERSFAASMSSDAINFHFLPGVSEDSYSLPGDINIGALALTLDGTDTPAMACSKDTYRLTYTSDTTEAIAFAVDLVNRDPTLLPNVTLGFVIRGVCYSPSVALATALSFLPRSERVCNNDSVCTTQAMMSSDSNWHTHDVIGVIASGLDRQTTLVSSLYAVAHLPLIGAIEPGDELSNKENHPYFFRIAPPSIYQVKAILKFISTNDWSYISIIYEEGPYGQQSYENMQRNAEHYGICIATSHRLDFYTDYNAVVADLLNFPRARAVVLFVGGKHLREVLRGVKNHNASGHFIFLGSHTIVNYSGFKYFGTSDDPSIGIFTFDLYYTYIMPFYKWLLKQRVSTTGNPWLRGAFEYIMECSYDRNQTKIRICRPDKNIFETYRYRTNNASPLRIDGVLTFAHAAHKLLSERCPDARGKEARACITGQLLREYLKDTKLDGYNGHIEFDENQDVKGKYVIGQFIYDYHPYPFTTYRRFKHMTRKNIGVYDAFTDTITYYLEEPITWGHVNTLDRIVPWTNNSLSIEIPESVCSRPCVVGEYKIEKEVPCCWECLRCRDNERLVDGNTSCEACPIFTWPDPTSDFTTCIDIPPSYPKMTDVLPIILNSLAVLFLIVTMATFTGYYLYRNERVIKASSKELSMIQLVAIFAGYTTVILFQTTPTYSMCSAIFFLFCMSFALLYCPLLVKTVRIFRIFKAGTKNEKPSLISPRSQLVFTTVLIAVQITLSTAVYILFEPKARLTQPIWSEKMVELSCDLTFPGLVSFLGYNIVLVFLCSVFAFKVRKLPDNFNESKFISMCVSTTLLIWLAFTPTYFTADREYIRVFLLSMALILNHSVALILLFLPKIYAARFLPPEVSTFSGNRS